MTLDDAITNHTWAAIASSGQVAEEHRQQAEWLAELKELKSGERSYAALAAENARYRELVEILRRDWLIEASWDGLRKFWYVGLTEEGVRERDARDRMCLAAMSENCSDCAVGMGQYADSMCDPLKIEIGELRELVRDMWLFTSLTSALVGEIHSREHGTWNADVFRNRMQDLGIEVE